MKQTDLSRSAALYERALKVLPGGVSRNAILRASHPTYEQFSKRLGLPPSTLYRLERGEQSITLRGLQQIMKRLRCTLTDISPA